MGAGSSRSKDKPRELRRRVVVPARLRHGASWSDACILNISSRGLMIHSGRPLSRGTTIELRRGDLVIVATVMWRDGGRAGLRAEEPLPVQEMVMLGEGASHRLAMRPAERRRNLRLEDASRLRGRAFEFATIVAIAASLGSAVVAVVEQAFAHPLSTVANALSS